MHNSLKEAKKAGSGAVINLSLENDHLPPPHIVLFGSTGGYSGPLPGRGAGMYGISKKWLIDYGLKLRVEEKQLQRENDAIHPRFTTSTLIIGFVRDQCGPLTYSWDEGAAAIFFSVHGKYSCKFVSKFLGRIVSELHAIVPYWLLEPIFVRIPA